MRKPLSILGWTTVSLLGAGAFAWLALSRGETVSAAWLLVAALCTYAVAYRFYSRIIAARIFALDARRPTPSRRLEDGCDYVPTNRWIVFGHHFAAIAGPGPLVGPRSEEHTSELQSQSNLVCRLLLEKKKKKT